MNAPISSPIPQQKAGLAPFSAASSAASSTQQSPSNQIIPPPQTEQMPASTDVFLKDFTLVAEAAKRAQMAVMMRDFESCGL